MFRILVTSFSFTILFSIGCGMGGDILLNNGACEGYGDAATSTYALPYQTGETYEVSQGNCRGITHFGLIRYSYDFDMNVGITIIASRAGTVTQVLAEGDDFCLGNFVMVSHGDGTHARYMHLSSTSVTVGTSVSQGTALGLSGATGCTGGFPHLHFDVSKESDPKLADTIPINFSNAGTNPVGLRTGKSYTAL